MEKLVVVVSLLLIGGGSIAQPAGKLQDESPTKEDCVSRDEFESLQKDLNYWQNTTINILQKYLVDNEKTSSQCSEIENVHLQDNVEDLDKKIEGLLNKTQGILDIAIKITDIEEQLQGFGDQLSHPQLGSFLNPAPSCKFIQEGSPSGHYWIQHTATGYANLEYCHMTRRCCNSTGGWMRVAHLNMTDENQRCPSGFRLITSPKRTCGTPGGGCVSTTFPLNGVKYSRVCGKIIAYQIGKPNGFGPYRHSSTLEGTYVDGVSLTHGQGPRNHIWTFANAMHETETRGYHFYCPCIRSDSAHQEVVPPFVGEDYFCDTGSENDAVQGQFYDADPLWDGSGCARTSSCCTFNNPPWFCKELPQPTSDDIEMRVCLNNPITTEDLALESVELYVQ